MGLQSSLIRMLEARRQRARLRRSGALGDFHRAGGGALLLDVPVTSDDVVIDAGGFEGDWTAAMLVRYGCHVEVFEPVPQFAARCAERFGRNARVRVRREALGGSTRTTRFAIDALASSEFARGASVEAEVVDVAVLVDELAARFGDVGCLKLNVEGGEYETLERLLGSGAISRCRSILVQHHAQPEGWRERLAATDAGLRSTHERAWGFPMVWEKWVRRG